MEKKLLIYNIAIFSIAIIIIVILVFSSHTQKKIMSIVDPSETTTLWKYQCIDTMKTSRDKARIWMYQTDLHNDVKKQIQIIKSLGANCVAIDTPYDTEFLPYLTSWASAAHAAGLHVWFRGNFSSWEGWFDYPKGMTADQLFEKTRTFITTHPDPFEDGDIFTAAPEAENGGPFNQVEPNRYAEYRTFLIDEYTNLQQDFAAIHKNVTINWFSMNGGFARRMLDQSTIDNIGKTVTIDHYIKTPQEMGNYISYFHKTFGAQVVIGEWGAPIPEINGDMTEDQQATFVNQLLHQMYQYKNDVVGINYWTLYDGSTALLNEDRTPRKAANVIKKYYIPKIITGTITDAFKSPLSGVTVKTADGISETTTNANGTFRLIIPQEATIVEFTKPNYTSPIKTYSISPLNVNTKIQMKEIHQSLIEKIKLFFEKKFFLFH